MCVCDGVCACIVVGVSCYGTEHVADKRATLFKGKKAGKVLRRFNSVASLSRNEPGEEARRPSNQLLSSCDHAAGLFYSNLTHNCHAASLAVLFMLLREDVNKTNE